MLTKWVVTAVVLACISVEAHARPIAFDNGSPDISRSAFLSEAPNGLAAIAENFRLRDQIMLREVVWTGGYGGLTPAEDNFTIRIFQSLGGIPDEGNQLVNVALIDGAVKSTDLQLTNPDGIELFEYQADLQELQVSLLPDVVYWLSISSMPRANSSWGWQQSLGTASSLENFAAQNRDGPWRSSAGTPEYAGIEFAFRLTAAVPEPSTGLLLLVGALVAFGARLSGGRARRAREGRSPTRRS
jgi:hypothetical protein